MQELLEMIAYGQMIDEMFLEIRNEIIDRRVINYLKVKYLLLFRKGFVIINNDKLDKTTKGIAAKVKQPDFIKFIFFVLSIL